MGIIELQWHCYFRQCRGNLFSLNGLYQGLIIHIESIGIFATFLLGKKLYDAQIHITQIEKDNPLLPKRHISKDWHDAC